MGIQVSTNFDLASQVPLDSRITVSNQTERNALATNNQAYPGIIVYVTGENKYYYYNGISWVEFGSLQDLVYTSGNQTVSGIKSFTTRPIVNGTGVLLSGEAYPLNNPSNYVQIQQLNDLQPDEGGVVVLYADGLWDPVSENIVFKAQDSDLIIYRNGSPIAGITPANLTSYRSYVLPDSTGTIALLFNTNPILAPNLVYNTGNQTISGNKSFKNSITYGLGSGNFDFGLVTNISTESGDKVSFTRGGLIPAPHGYGIVFEGGSAVNKKGYLTLGATPAPISYEYATLDWTNRILSGQWKTDQRLTVNDSGVLLEGESSPDNIEQLNLIYNGPIIEDLIPKTFLPNINANIKRYVNVSSSNVPFKIVLPTGDIANGRIVYLELFGQVTNGYFIVSGLQSNSTETVDRLGASREYTYFDSLGWVPTNSFDNNYVDTDFYQVISGLKDFTTRPTVNNTGILLNGEAVLPLVDINNITTNFNFSDTYNSKLLTINASENITGTIPTDLEIGYNVAFVQMGTGQLFITGQNGVTIRQRLNLYNTAGQYAIASLVHRENNEYILYGDLA